MIATSLSHFKLAIHSIKHNKMRSFLTCLGIGIGIGSITLILSLVGSVNQLLRTQFASSSSDLVIVRPTAQIDTSKNFIETLTSSNLFQKSHLELSFIKPISRLDQVAATAPILLSTQTLSTAPVQPPATPQDQHKTQVTLQPQTVNSVPILGTTSDFIKIQTLPLKSGSFFTDFSNPNSAIIGRSLALELFHTTEAVGNVFTLNQKPIIVIGVLLPQPAALNLNGVDLNQTAIMQADFLKALAPDTQVQQINIRAKHPEQVDQVATKVGELLRAKTPEFSLDYGDHISHPANSFLNIISQLLTVIASISLLVGGIGIMNIMLVSVAERTREIGIRKAVGASTIHLLFQFLFESLILSCLGGLIGIGLGYALALIISLLSPLPPHLSPTILFTAFITSFVVGVVFGLYPALKAACKSPVSALKHFH